MTTLTPLPIPVPPMLEQALGYDHEHPSAWVGFYWEPAGDEARYADGQRAGDGDWSAYLLYVRHARVAPHLAGYNLGSSDEPAAHYLLLDRRERRRYVAPARAAREHLRAQWSWDKRPAAEWTPEDWARVQASVEEAMRQAPRQSQAGIVAEVRARMAAQRRLCEELAAWLNERAAPDANA